MQREKLIENLKLTGALKSPQIEAAFRDVDRALFVPMELSDEAYEDYALPIGYGATISQPATVAFMLEKLDPRVGDSVLDIGSGSGWTTALLAHLVGPKGRVIGLEILSELVALGRSNVQNWYSVILKNNRIRAVGMPEMRQAKKGAAGLSEEGPYDRILVSAAAESLPEGLVQQLKQNGALVLPVGRQDEVQKILKILKKTDGSLDTEEYPGFVFVPLR